MKRSAATLSLALFWVVALTFFPSAAQPQDEPESHRKVVKRVMPTYPALANTINLGGNVKVNVLVAPNGTAKSVTVKGGHPLLVEAAQDAIRKWKWEPAAHETNEFIEVNFHPQH